MPAQAPAATNFCWKSTPQTHKQTDQVRQGNHNEQPQARNNRGTGRTRRAGGTLRHLIGTLTVLWMLVCVEGKPLEDLPWSPTNIQKNRLNRAIHGNDPGPGKRGRTHTAGLSILRANVTSLTANEHLFADFDDDVVAIQEVNANEFECKTMRRDFKRQGKHFTWGATRQDTREVLGDRGGGCAFISKKK